MPPPTNKKTYLGIDFLKSRQPTKSEFEYRIASRWSNCLYINL